MDNTQIRLLLFLFSLIVILLITVMQRVVNTDVRYTRNYHSVQTIILHGQSNISRNVDKSMPDNTMDETTKMSSNSNYSELIVVMDRKSNISLYNNNHVRNVTFDRKSNSIHSQNASKPNLTMIATLKLSGDNTIITTDRKSKPNQENNENVSNIVVDKTGNFTYTGYTNVSNSIFDRKSISLHVNKTNVSNSKEERTSEIESFNISNDVRICNQNERKDYMRKICDSTSNKQLKPRRVSFIVDDEHKIAYCGIPKNSQLNLENYSDDLNKTRIKHEET